MPGSGRGILQPPFGSIAAAAALQTRNGLSALTAPLPTVVTLGAALATIHPETTLHAMDAAARAIRSTVRTRM